MAGPWEKYAQQPAQDGPWAKYGKASEASQSAPESSIVDTIKQGAGDLIAGGIRGAGSIGATLLYPWDKAQDLYYGDRQAGVSSLVTGKKPLSRNEERRQAMDEGLRLLGANPDSLMYKGGKLAVEVAGTAGAGGALANVARVAAPGMAATQTGANLLRAIETAGTQGGNLLSRSAGGAVSGAATAGLVNPNEAGTGMLIGGAAPGVMQIMGKAGSYVGSKLRGGAADPQKLAAARAAQKAGYVIPPSDIQPQGIFTETLGGLSGKIKTAQEASARNAKVTTSLAKREIGLPDDVPLTIEALDSVRAKAGDAYGAVASLGKLPAKAGDLPKSVNVKSFTDKLTFAPKTEVDAAEVVRAWKQANHDATGYYRAYGRDANPETLAKARQAANEAKKIDDFIMKSIAKVKVGDANRLIADLASGRKSMNQFMDETVKMATSRDLGEAIKAARVQIAKTYTIEKALNGTTGEVSAQALAKDLAKGKALSGGLLTAAKTGQAFPKATQALKEAPKAVSPLDWAVGAMGGTATGNPLMLGTLLARPATRNMLLSNPMQAYAARDIGPSALTSALTPQNQLLLQRSLPVLAADR